MSTTLPTTAPSHSPPNGDVQHKPLPSRLRTHFSSPVSPTFTSLPLLLCCFISGLADSAAYNAWSAFVSMQTGNTIFLALGASNQPATRPYGWLKSFTSILCFSLGCALFARLMRRLGYNGRTKLGLAGSFAIQALFMFVAAALATKKVVPVPVGVVSPTDVDFVELVPIGLLAFQAGGQMVASRVLGHGEIPTTVLTSVYCDFASDANLFRGVNGARDRRITGITCLLLGGITGGWISRSEAGLGTVLWLGGALKIVLVGAWLGWKEEVEGQEKGEKDRRGW